MWGKIGFKREYVSASESPRGTFYLQLDWKANSNIIITGLVSIICWIGFAASVLPPVQNQTIGGILVIVAIITLLMFGYLLDKRLEGVI